MLGGRAPAGPLQQSLVLRLCVAFAVIFPGFLLNYALHLFAGRILPAGQFGIFYTAVSILNVLHAPMVIIGLVYSRQITEGLVESGLPEALGRFSAFVRRVAAWSGMWTAFLIVVFLSLGLLLRLDSIPLVVLLPLAAFANNLGESIRIGLQGLQRYLSFGVVTLAWLVCRFALGLLGLLALGRVWAGIGGVGLAGLLVLAVGHWLVLGGGSAVEVPRVSLQPVPLQRLGLIGSAFCLFALLTYLDPLLAYLTLGRWELSVYSASSVLPKSIVAVAFPLSRMLFSVMVDTQARGRSQRSNVAKGLGLMTVLSCSGVAILAVLGGPLSHSAVGIVSSDPELMLLIALSAIPLCLLLVLVLLQLTRGLDAQPLLLAVPAVLYGGFVMMARPDVRELALSYLVFSWTTLVAYAVVCALPGARRSPTESHDE